MKAIISITLTIIILFILYAWVTGWGCGFLGQCVTSTCWQGDVRLVTCILAFVWCIPFLVYKAEEVEAFVGEYSKVTRLEVINHQDEPFGRVFTKYNCERVDVSLQDDGRTLKIFISAAETEESANLLWDKTPLNSTVDVLWVENNGERIVTEE